MEKESCESCINAFPCQKHCGECGKLLNSKFPTNPHCHFSHLGYKSEGGHKFCPECGEKLEQISIASVLTRETRKREALPPKPLLLKGGGEKKFIEINICPHCQSSAFEIIYGGQHKKQCKKCHKFFQENRP